MTTMTTTSTAQTATAGMGLGQKLVLLDAVQCVVAGAALELASGVLAGPVGAPGPLLFGIGAVTFAWGLVLLRLGTLRPFRPWAIGVAAAANALSLVACLIQYELFSGALTQWGVLGLAALAVDVAVFGAAQFYAWRRATSSSTGD